MNGKPSQPSRQRDDKAAGKKTQRRDGAGRRLAEWVSLAVSGLLLLSLAGYLLLQALRPGTPYVVAETRPLLEQVHRKGSTFVLPLEVTNPGTRTQRDLKVEVRFRSAEGQWETRELQFDYLGQESRRTVYLYFDRHPRELQVEARPVHYRLD